METEVEYVDYTRVYADADGESHFSDEQIPMHLANFSPGAPPSFVSDPIGATDFGFLQEPQDWVRPLGPAPSVNYWFVLSGTIEMTTSDGDTRIFPTGGIFLIEDTTGKGHSTRSIGDEVVLFARVSPS